MALDPPCWGRGGAGAWPSAGGRSPTEVAGVRERFPSPFWGTITQKFRPYYPIPNQVLVHRSRRTPKAIPAFPHPRGLARMKDLRGGESPIRRTPSFCNRAFEWQAPRVYCTYNSQPNDRRFTVRLGTVPRGGGEWLEGSMRRVIRSGNQIDPAGITGGC